MNRFHDNNGWLMVGLDRHMGIHWPTPIPFPCMFLELNAVHPFWMGPKQVSNVQINGGKNTVVDQHESYVLWPHFPIAPDPLNMLFPIDLLLGSHKTMMPRGNVHIGGTPAAITVSPAAGLSINMDCWTFPGGISVSVPSSIIYQEGTVVTSASWRDYLTAGVRVAIAYIMYRIGRGRTARPTARPTGIRGWSNVRRATQYMLRPDRAGRAARSTFRNALGRNLASRMLPQAGARNVGTWAARNIFGTPQGILNGAAQTIATGNPSSALPVPSWKGVVANTIPPLGGVTGFVESWGQKDLPPPFG